MSAVKPKHYDIVIVGGGMVGATLACALLPMLQKHKLTLAIVESKPAADLAQPSYDGRSTALSWGARGIFEDLGLWAPLTSQADSQPSAIKHIHVSNKGQFAFARIAHADMDVEALGYVVENRLLGQVLHQELQQRLQQQNQSSGAAPIQWLCPAEVESMQAEAGGMRLDIKHQGKALSLLAGLCVMADGGRSGLSASVGISQSREDYGSHAIIANVEHSKSHQGCAYERFTDEGPMAMLPLAGSRSALVWTMPEALAQQRLALSEAEFAEVLQERFGFRLGRIENISNRASYPLSLSWASEQVRPNLVLLGNAAHAMHPVAGQGFNLALRDLMVLVEELESAAAAGKPMGELTTLLGYLAKQGPDQHQTMGGSDQLVKLFTSSNGLSSLLANLGLLALDHIPSAKRWFAREAMGLGAQARGTGLTQK